MRYALRRLGFFVLTLWVALTLNFLLPRLIVRGTPRRYDVEVPRRTQPKALNALEILFGVNARMRACSAVFRYPAPDPDGQLRHLAPRAREVAVTSVIGSAIWWTVGLVGITTVLAFILGTGLGIVAAWRRGGKLDSIVPPVLVITSAIPYSGWPWCWC